jgi:xanthine/uracil/vitamin C permease (AzgA family)
MWLVTVIRVLLAVLALRGFRWAYVAFMVLGLLYFPLKVNFRFDPHPCELIFDGPLAIHSLTNFPHIVLFALGYVLTAAQFQLSKWSSFIWSAALILLVGALVEILQGVTGQGHCRALDLIPDTAGALIGALIVLGLYRIGWRPRPSWSFR